MPANGDPLVRLLGPGWPQMSYGQLADRAYTLERAAGFARTLVRYMAEVDADTAGDAVARLQASRADEEWRSNGR